MRRKKNVKKGIQFCLMVCGASGTGTPPYLATISPSATHEMFQGVLLLSILFAVNGYFIAKIPMIQPMRTWKRV